MKGGVEVRHGVDNVQAGYYVVVAQLNSLFAWRLREVIHLRDHVLVGEGLRQAAG